MCLSPITRRITVDGEVRIQTVPCGHCLECVAKFQNEWALRLAEESKQWKYSIFVTLKYANSRIPLADLDVSDNERFINESLAKLPAFTALGRYADESYEYLQPCGSVRTVPILDKSDVVSLMKRVRMRLTRAKVCDADAFKYFVTGEYGPTTLRPHYHAIIFTNVQPALLQHHFHDVWLNIAGDATYRDMCFDWSLVRDSVNVARYVAKYCCKPPQFDNPYVTYGYIPKPCHLISKGIGSILRTRLAQGVTELCKRYNLPYASPFELREKIREWRKNMIEDTFPNSCITSGLSSIDFARNIVKEIPSAFFEELSSLFKREVYSHGKVLTYSMPRYYRDWVMPQRYYVRPVYNYKSQCYEDKVVFRKDPSSSIAEGYRQFIDSCIIDEYNRHITDYVNNGYSEDDAHLQVSRDEVENMRLRYTSRLDAFVKFYNKGYFRSINSSYE